MDFLLPSPIFLALLAVLIAGLPAVAFFYLWNADYKNNNAKLIWLFVILMIPIIGPILFLTIGRKPKAKIA